MNRSGGKTGFPTPVNRYFLFMAQQRFVNPFVLAKAPNANVCSGSYLTLTSIFALLLYTFCWYVHCQYPTTVSTDNRTRLCILNLIKFHFRAVFYIYFSLRRQASR